jgi:hypothetical protein
MFLEAYSIDKIVKALYDLFIFFKRCLKIFDLIYFQKTNCNFHFIYIKIVIKSYAFFKF